MRNVRTLACAMTVLAGAAASAPALITDGDAEGFLTMLYISQIFERDKAAKPEPIGVAVRLASRGTSTYYGLDSIPFDLHAPFLWKTTAGRIDAAAPGPMSGFFCTELDERGSSPLEYWSLCAEPSDGGFDVWVSRRGQNFVAQLHVPAADRLDFEIEHDGTQMIFRVRPAGTGEYATVTTLPHVQGTAALVPAFGGANLPGAATVDFDDFRIVSNGPLPEGATPAEGAARPIADAAVPLLDAFHRLEFAAEDPGVAADLATAAEGLAAQETPVETFAGRKAAKKVRSAAKATAKAQALVAGNRPLKSTAKATWKALNAVVAALQAVDPHSLPQ